MEGKTYSIKAIKESLKNLEKEALKLDDLSRGIPAIGKNLNAIMAFIDILKHHINDLNDEMGRDR